ncbi:LacI family DNA-binding transcriptional regulator [Kineococcus sp. NPDC059986]|jgi:LacI family transcriptional regulator|uniref:LacI family DNA-binding transcriptional regulator n=1 Tax=Kineococcus sp. NPDC059986 TaxID=3155538 RepID=UPI003450413E
MARHPSRGASADEDRTPTVYDVADRASVSIATVSRVLRTPDAVREATRARVLDAVRDLGYVPSGNARALAGRKTGVIGLCFPGHDALEEQDRPAPDPGGGVRVVDDRRRGAAPHSPNLYFDEVLRGAEVEAWRRGFALMVAAGRGPARDVIVNDIAGRVDGLAVLARTVSDDLLTHVARRLPVVLLADAARTGAEPPDGLDHVSVDNAAGMQALVTHVVQGLGVRDPGSVVYVAGPADSPDDAERQRGLFAALDAAGVDRSAVPHVRGDFRRDTADRAVTDLLAQRVPRALVCANDQSALGALDALRRRGLRVPDDVYVTGFDGLDVGRFTEPPLTTVAQPMAELGRAAVRAVVDRLSDPGAPLLSARLPVEVLLRESCPPVDTRM